MQHDNLLLLQQYAGQIRMRDGVKIFRHAEGRKHVGWAVRSDDDLWLCARGDDAAEVEWDMDRRTFFGTLEGAIEAWGRAFQKKPGLWKGE
jgi:hypothetical protein